uniref:DDE Tnp4 domain-containing protein n=1 Tax=Brassica oleracea var. oleracea TaxID=109376 RepID=A0A0D3DJY4_BRAOL
MASSSYNNLEEFDERFDERFDQIFDQQFENLRIRSEARQEASRSQKKRAYIERQREQGHLQLWNDYFSEDATYPSHMFRRRFRMNKPLFMLIVDRLSAEIPYFQHRRDATGRFGHSPLQKATAAIRMMAYGSPADAVDEYLRLGETTALLCLEHFVQGIINIFGDDETPTYPENFFRRRFRMNKPLFMRIVDRLSNEVPYFRQKKDALGRLGISSLQKCTAAIRVLAYGTAADTVDEYLRLGESTTRKCVEHFVEGIINLFGDEYLRRPIPADLQRLLDIGEYRGFPRMIGSIDCMHWEWKNCPTAWKGQYTRGSGKPTIVLEAVASQDLWIWHARWYLSKMGYFCPIYSPTVRSESILIRYTSRS